MKDKKSYNKTLIEKLSTEQLEHPMEQWKKNDITKGQFSFLSIHHFLEPCLFSVFQFPTINFFPLPPPSFAKTIAKYFWEYADLPRAFHINSLCKTTPTTKYLLRKYTQKNWNNLWNNNQTFSSSVKSNFLITTFILYFLFSYNSLCLSPKFCINYCVWNTICRYPMSIWHQWFMPNLGDKQRIMGNGEIENKQNIHCFCNDLKHI